MTMKRVCIWIVLAACAIWSSSATRAQQAPTAEPTADAKPAAPATQPTQADLEKKFEETMTGAVLVGQFTARGREENPREDRYTIVSAKKLMGDRWVITAKLQYRGEAVAIPIIVPLKWAGDTPVISVTDMTIPGMGSYTARVMIFRDQYTGMWDAGDHGGLMWGKIERAPATSAPTTAPANARDSKPEGAK
jgi:hypothetical protein